MLTVLLLVVVFVALLNASIADSHPVTVHAEWAVLNYTWNEKHTYNDYISSQKFIPENCLLAGINVDIDGSIYVTVPRWRNGVPATLNKYDPSQNTLTPFPSWDMQQEGVSGDLQNVQSMTIDAKRRMWVIEVGRRNFFIKNPKIQVSGPAGIWMIDMDTHAITNKYYFPADVVTYDNSFLNDIVVDITRDIAYLTDAWGDGALITYDLAKGISRRYTGPSTKPDSSYAMVINGVNYGKIIFTTPTDGIAMTEDNEALFFCQVQGTSLYRVPTALLRDFSSSTADITAAVERIGYKEPSDGMKYLNGVLYYGSLTTSTFYHLPITATSLPDMAKESIPVTPNVEVMQWLDTFAIDPRANTTTKLWFVSNRLDEYSVGTMDYSGANGANMRIATIDLTKL